MSRRPRPAALGAAAALLAVLAAGLPATAIAWGSLGHRTIAANWVESLPWPLDGLASEETWVVDHVMDPDLRKSSVPGEGYRHYIDIDVYPAYHTGTLSHDRATLEATYGAAQVAQWGIVPWAIGEVTDSLTAAMATARWDRARMWIADLCHYVGDLHQPLHCTQNYDGQLTGNNGIHSRYETRMLDLNAASLLLTPGAAGYVADPVELAFAIAGVSQVRSSDVLVADTEARAAAGGSTSSTTYYNGLWTRTQELTLARLDDAALTTASLVYTAWADAGYPPVPNATVDAPGGATLAPFLAAGPNPARGRVELRFVLPVAASPAFTIVDARGRVVARLEAGPQPAGPGRLGWALPAAGAGARPPGVYFVRMTVGAREARARVVVLP